MRRRRRCPSPRLPPEKIRRTFGALGVLRLRFIQNGNAGRRAFPFRIRPPAGRFLPSVLTPVASRPTFTLRVKPQLQRQQSSNRKCQGTVWTSGERLPKSTLILDLLGGRFNQL